MASTSCSTDTPTPSNLLPHASTQMSDTPLKDLLAPLLPSVTCMDSSTTTILPNRKLSLPCTSNPSLITSFHCHRKTIDVQGGIHHQHCNISQARPHYTSIITPQIKEHMALTKSLHK